MVETSKGKVLVMGLARSGRAVARLLLQKGYTVILNDQKEPERPDAELDALEAQGVVFVFGEHPLTLLEEDTRFLVKNPGIPYRVPLVKEAMARGIPVYTEIEVASWYAEGPIISITGSNGKTTTTTLVGHIMEAAKLNPIVAGNIGTAFSAVVQNRAPRAPFVLEVSSFQLEGTSTFRPHIASILNLVPAHLDYHGTFESYAAAKWKIFANQTSEDYAVLNHDQPLLVEGARRLKSKLFWFSTRSRAEMGEVQPFRGVCVEDGQIVVVEENRTTVVLPVDKVSLPGRHNLQNAVAAAAISWLAGAPKDAIESVLSSFGGVEHRLEFVRTKDGVSFYNDSKSTNPTAALQALTSFPRDIIWIAGGLNRKDDYQVLHDDVKERVKAAFLYGETKDDMSLFCRNCGVEEVRIVGNLNEAVEAASKFAKQGDVVLLSPACASWDMFTSFEERGRMFKEVVHRL